MPKRVLSSRPDVNPFSSERNSKRPASFWLGAQCWQYDRKTLRPRPRTTFLDLPLELREEIYHFAMIDMGKKINHPWDPLPGLDRFEAYCNLRLINRQVSAEAKKIFKRYYEPDMILYFDNTPDLWDQWQMLKDHPRRRMTRFYLRAMNDDETAVLREAGENLIREDIEMLIEAQHDVNEWLDCPSMYDCYCWDQYMSGDKRMPDGFVMKLGDHFNCDLRPSTECERYRELEYPPIAQSLSIRGYAWRQKFPHEDIPGRYQYWDIGSHVLQGDICDINWGGYDIQASRDEVFRQRNGEDYGHSDESLSDGDEGDESGGSDEGAGIDNDILTDLDHAFESASAQGSDESSADESDS